MKRKLFSLLLVLAMLLSMSSGALAAHVTPEISAPEIEAGQTVDVTLKISEEVSYIVALQYDVYFDAALFDYTSSVRGESNEKTTISTQKTDAATGETYYSVLYVDNSAEGDPQTFTVGTLYTLTFTAKQDISETAAASFRVLEKALDTNIFQSLRDADYQGTLSVTVKAGEEPPAVTGYSVAISEDQTKNIGETATVNVAVNSSEYDSYNTVDMSFNYDADKLELTTTEIDGYILKTPSTGTIRVQRYGSSCQVGNAFALDFECIAAGTAEVKVSSAYVDNSSGAATQDIPPATITADTVTITITPPAPTAVSIAVSGNYKTEYLIGDEFDATGIVVTATMSDGSTQDVTANTTFSGFDSTTVGTKTITATYGELTVTFTVTVKEKTQPGGGGGGGGGGAPAPTTYEISIPETENGTVTISPEEAAADAEVTITATPDEGYELAEITVTDEDGNEIALTENEDGTYSFVMPAGPVTVSATFKEKEGAADRFIDVHEGDWFYDAVYWAADNGLMIGTGNSMFSPNLPLTRGMVATVLYRMEGEPEAKTENPFSDVEDGQWYTDAVNWAAENGIILGYPDGRFAPLADITREQLAAIMMRYAAYKGRDVTVQADLSSFADGDDVSGWAKENVSWAVAVGLIKGRDGNRIAPLENATRAEAAMVFMRLDAYLA